MKVNKNMFKIAAVSVTGVAAAMIVGCKAPTIPVTMKIAGEVSMTGVSKIALADFNSLKGDAFTGAMAADAETCALVKRAVASAFYASPMYQVVDMDAESKIFKAQNSRPDKRFDAIVYGRLWWNVTPETSGQYPKQFTLSTWSKIPYTQKVLGKAVPAVANVTTETKDVIQMLDYRAQEATLMLSLSVYTLDENGGISKVVDTYQVTNQGFTLMNGEMKVDTNGLGMKEDSEVARLQKTGAKDELRSAYEEMFVPKEETIIADVGKAALGAVAGFGASFKAVKDAVAPEEKKEPVDKNALKRDPNGKVILSQDVVAMPTELQAKLMLATAVSRGLTAKLAPSEVTFNVPADLGDKRLLNLLKNGAYKSAKEYSLYMLRSKLGKQICAKLSRHLPEFGEECSYPVPESQKQIPGYNEALVDELMKGDFNVYFYTLGTAHACAVELEKSANYNDAMIAYLASENLDIYLYALGISCEAKGDMENAEDYYRYAFNVKPSMAPALGLSRVKMATAQSGKLRKVQKAKRKAAEASEITM